MRWIDLNEFPSLREHVEAARGGELVLIRDGAENVVAFIGVPGRPLKPWEGRLIENMTPTDPPGESS